MRQTIEVDVGMGNFMHFKDTPFARRMQSKKNGNSTNVRQTKPMFCNALCWMDLVSLDKRYEKSKIKRKIGCEISGVFAFHSFFFVLHKIDLRHRQKNFQLAGIDDELFFCFCFRLLHLQQKKTHFGRLH